MYSSDSLHPAEALQVPVAFMVFNRPGTTQRVFDAIAAARPVKLLLIADGPRPNKEGEAEACRRVRDIVSHVDWPCEVFRNYSDINLGCDPRIVSGVDWVFSIVEEAIILEDDCLPDPSFFVFCQEMLDKYRGDSRVAAISGTNLVEKHIAGPDSYYFSLLGGNWGWATWKTQWLTYDRRLKQWPIHKKKDSLINVFEHRKASAYWTKIFDEIYRGGENTPWDYHWLYSRLTGHKLTIVPHVNLVENIGFGPGSSHTTTVDRRFMPTRKAIAFPLNHPAGMVPSRRLDSHFQNLLELSLTRRIANKFKKILDTPYRAR